MKINRSFRSPNFDSKPIPVEFIVLHYTACSLQSTLEIFRDPEKRVSSHLIISTTGEIYEPVKCWDGEVQRAWHAGKSSFHDGKKEWRDFNDFSIGIEIVNLNGNFLDYSDKQYESLAGVLEHFKSKYKNLSDPQRLIGHEQIAGFRGKVDPGWKFDWERIYNACYPGMTPPERKPILQAELKDCLEKFLNFVPHDEEARAKFWQALSQNAETVTRLLKS